MHTSIRSIFILNISITIYLLYFAILSFEKNLHSPFPCVSIWLGEFLYLHLHLRFLYIHLINLPELNLILSIIDFLTFLKLELSIFLNFIKTFFFNGFAISYYFLLYLVTVNWQDIFRYSTKKEAMLDCTINLILVNFYIL